MKNLGVLFSFLIILVLISGCTSQKPVFIEKVPDITSAVENNLSEAIPNKILAYQSCE